MAADGVFIFFSDEKDKLGMPTHFASYHVFATQMEQFPGFVVFSLLTQGDAKDRRWGIEPGPVDRAWASLEEKLRADHPGMKLIKKCP